MTDAELILRQLMIDGHEGASLLAAFGRWMRALNGAVQAVAQPMVAAPAKRKPKAAQPDRRQLNMMLASDGGQAKAPPMSAAERQAKRRATLKSVTLRDTKPGQAFEIIEESRNVTTPRNGSAQVIDPVEEFAVSARDSVTRRGKKNSPHTPLRKTLPPNPPNHADCVTVPWDHPLIPFLDTVAGKLRGRFGAGRTVYRRQLDQARQLMAEASTAPPLKATG